MRAGSQWRNTRALMKRRSVRLGLLVRTTVAMDQPGRAVFAVAGGPPLGGSRFDLKACSGRANRPAFVDDRLGKS